MTRHCFLSAVVSGVFLLSALASLFSVSVRADDADSARRADFESAKAEAADLLRRGQAAEACEIYLRLLREEPEDDAVNLGLARAASSAGRWNQAVMAYERLLDEYPGEASFYPELARAYVALNDKASAERALASMRLLDASATAEVTDALMEKLENRYGLVQVHGKVRFGVAYDTNANQGPMSDALTLGNWRVNLDNAKAVKSFGAYLGADVDLGRRFYRDSPWWIVGDAQVLFRGNENDALRFGRGRESQWLRAAVGLRRLSSESLLDARLKAETFDMEMYQRVFALGPEVVFLWAVTPSARLITRGGVDRRVHSRDHQRDGEYYSAGEYLRLFLGQSDHSVMVGARYMGASADRKDYDYDGWETSARLTLSLFRDLEFAPFVSFSRETYDGPATVLETEKREDDKSRLGASLTYRLTESWSVEAAFQYVKNESNSALYDYDQRLVSAGMVWSF
jgi:tetratricopeptide (TPR) repeat protein